MHESLKNIEGFDISFHKKSKRIINIEIEDTETGTKWTKLK